MSVMQTVRAHTFGGPEVLRIDELPVPAPGPGEVLIRVQFASVNFADVMRRRDDPYPLPTALPFTPGSEIAGEVVAHGAQVTRPALGTMVFALTGIRDAPGTSGYAQYVVVDATRVVPLPPGLNAEVACSLFVAGLTAMLILRNVAGVTTDTRILVQGAAGAVGSYAMQLARHLGAAQVIGAASSDERRAQANTQGAHVTIDSTQPGWPEAVLELTNGAGVDVVLEIGGGDSLEAGLRCLSPFGRAVIYGTASGAPLRLSDEALMRTFHSPALNQSLHVFNLGLWFVMRPDAVAESLGTLISLLLEGRIAPPPIEVLPLARAAEAHRLLESRKVSGKIVLDPWSAA